MTDVITCSRCGKTNLHPDGIHTCTPKELVEIDDVISEARLYLKTKGNSLRSPEGIIKDFLTLIEEKEKEKEVAKSYWHQATVTINNLEEELQNKGFAIDRLEEQNAKLMRVFKSSDKLIAHIGCYGEIDSKHELVHILLGELNELDSE